MSKMIVARIEKQQNRTLLYDSRNDGYHVIADKNSTVKIGDTIEYEPYGINFGFYKGDKNDK